MKTIYYYILAVALISAWAIGCFVVHIGLFSHVLLLMGIIFYLHGLITGPVLKSARSKPIASE